MVVISLWEVSEVCWYVFTSPSNSTKTPIFSVVCRTRPAPSSTDGLADTATLAAGTPLRPRTCSSTHSTSDSPPASRHNCLINHKILPNQKKDPSTMIFPEKPFSIESQSYLLSHCLSKENVSVLVSYLCRIYSPLEVKRDLRGGCFLKQESISNIAKPFDIWFTFGWFLLFTK